MAVHKEIVKKMLDEISGVKVSEKLSDEEIDYMMEIFDESGGSQEEFINRAMIGNCSNCDSHLTIDCEEEPGVEDNTIGKCLVCDYRWCLECGEPIGKKDSVCGHWTICDGCEKEKECAMGMQSECPAITEWKKRRRGN